MKHIVYLFAVAFAVSAPADQFKTVKYDKSSKNYEFTFEIPQFNANSIPAYALVNKQIEQVIIDNSCDASEAPKSDIGFYDDTAGSVVALNKLYVGVSLSNDSYCGGAHPNTFTSFLTFNSQTGEMLDIAKEFGFLDYQDPKYDEAKQEVLHDKVAQILLMHIPPDNECFQNMKPNEKLDQLETMYPYVAGLAKNGTVVLGIEPAHVVAACGFYVRVSKKEVSGLLKKGSYLEKWLR